MFNSLRSRLWLTYAFLIGSILIVAGLGLAIFLLRAPQFVARQHVEWIAGVIQKREVTLENVSRNDLPTAVRRADALVDARIVVLSSQGKVLADSRLERIGPFPELPLNRIRNSIGGSDIFRDSGNRLWVYTTLEMPSGEFILIAVRPAFPYLQMFRQDVVPPLLWAGVVALLLAIILAVWISRWIVSPLQRITYAARSVAGKPSQHIPVEGPEEVQELSTAFNEMTARVQSSQISQRDFIANVSHELKTPLTSIQGFAQAILDDTAGAPEARKQAAGVIYSEAERMNQLVLSLLELARLDAGTAQLEQETVDLQAVLWNIVNKLTPQARASQVELHAEIPPLLTVEGDENRLTQVFTNLVDNALKFTSQGGKVTLTARVVGDSAEIRVMDTGPGISSQDLPHIFERFYQADKSRQGGQGHGVGLGLAIAREIVQAHRGTIRAESSPGQGATFVVSLPTARAEELAAGIRTL
jgi:signal transduction histidine kinase